MKALVYHGPGKKSWEEKTKPSLVKPTDAIVKITKTTICGTDLHILKGDVPEVTDGRIHLNCANQSLLRAAILPISVFMEKAPVFIWRNCGHIILLLPQDW
jgi:hypothetical protein